ncbi:DUF1249 domain-containing protein [Thalassolituus sp.]|uniref:DUF1249 domain-containing protein n=1 Tax=Thalassolituus sp. TaxID=2030822 RepID=UPI00261A558F|nr:DUF1249 domain-containing protein [uncultured Thalassolituus sp.]
MRPKRYVPDLQEMASLAESNYLRFLKLLPDASAGTERVFAISGSPEQNARVRMRVEEVHPYTTMLTVTQEGLCPEWIQPPSMQVRLYHDASMAEVLSYQNQHRFEGRYQYPNPQMRLPDEKVQLNRFLADWLEHCLKHGHTEMPFSFIPTF